MLRGLKEFKIKYNLNLFILRENYLLFLKFILLSNLSKNIKVNAYKLLFFNLVHKKAPSCLLTGRNRSVNLSLGLSRIILRKLIYEGFLLGFKKSSW